MLVVPTAYKHSLILKVYKYYLYSVVFIGETRTLHFFAYIFSKTAKPDRFERKLADDGDQKRVLYSVYCRLCAAEGQNRGFQRRKWLGLTALETGIFFVSRYTTHRFGHFRFTIFQQNSHVDHEHVNECFHESYWKRRILKISFRASISPKPLYTDAASHAVARFIPSGRVRAKGLTFLSGFSTVFLFGVIVSKIWQHLIMTLSTVTFTITGRLSTRFSTAFSPISQYTTVLSSCYIWKVNKSSFCL